MDLNSCDQCGKSNASIQYTEIAEGQISKLHLCQSCAQSHGLLGDMEETAPGIDALISKISRPESPQASTPLQGVASCPSCSLTWQEFERDGLLGCEECYKTFAAKLTPLMRQFHQADQHAGHGRRQASDPSALLPELRSLLDEAIREEDYEKAAMLRDKIQAAETPGSEGHDSSEQDQGDTPGT